MDSNEKTSSVAPLLGGFALGAMCGLLIAAQKEKSPRAGRCESGPLTPQELAEEFDLTANL